MLPRQVQDLMLVYAAGLADEREAAQAIHLLLCRDPAAQCALSEAYALLNILLLSLDPIEPSPLVWDRLWTRTQNERVSGLDRRFSPPVRPIVTHI